MKSLLTILLSLFLPIGLYARYETIRIKVSDDIELIRLSENAYMHISYTNSTQYGRISSNGLIYTNKGFAYLLDTPMTDTLTRSLVKWITDTMHLKIMGFIPNHWHVDCMGGLGYLQSIGIDSYSNQMTINIAKEKGLPLPAHGFIDSLRLQVGSESIYCYYFGAAHSLDNIVVWIPSEKILFAGCMLKDNTAFGLGNTVDGNISAWSITLYKILQKFPDAKILIPGHGNIGGLELINHTLELLKSN
jgi:metallo-beta-lactamase class B